jgi:hypothetical protein
MLYSLNKGHDELLKLYGSAEEAKRDTPADIIWDQGEYESWTGRLPNTDSSGAPAYTIRPESSSSGKFFRDVPTQGEAQTQEL